MQSYRKIDAHMHMGGDAPRWGFTDEAAIEAADKLGIEVLCVSNPITGNRYPEPDEIRYMNNQTMVSMRRWPDRVFGYAYINPGWQDDGLEEAERQIVVKDHDVIDRLQGLEQPSAVGRGHARPVRALEPAHGGVAVDAPWTCERKPVVSTMSPVSASYAAIPAGSRSTPRCISALI